MERPLTPVQIRQLRPCFPSAVIQNASPSSFLFACKLTCPKASKRRNKEKSTVRRNGNTTNTGTYTPSVPRPGQIDPDSLQQSLATQLSYLHHPRPFKNPNYTKNVNRRAKNLKTVLGQEREREKAEREARRLQREAALHAGEPVPEALEDVPTCMHSHLRLIWHKLDPSRLDHRSTAIFTAPHPSLRHHWS